MWTCKVHHFLPTVQATSEVGSAGLYLEDYFEEQLKVVYPDKVFPGGREEQMIPPLEDEIEDEEEEMMQEGEAHRGEDEPQNLEGKGIPSLEEDLDPEQETAATAEEEKLETVEKANDEEEKEKMMSEPATDGEVATMEEVQQEETTPAEAVKSSQTDGGETRQEGGPCSLKLETPELHEDCKTVEPPENHEEESAPVDTASQEEG